MLRPNGLRFTCAAPIEWECISAVSSFQKSPDLDRRVAASGASACWAAVGCVSASHKLLFLFVQPTLHKYSDIAIRIVRIRVIRNVNSLERETEFPIHHDRRCIGGLCLANDYPQA